MNTQEATHLFFKRINNFVFFVGVPTIYKSDEGFPRYLVKFHNGFGILINLILTLFMIFEWGATYTQKDLNDKQAFDSLVFNFTHPVMYWSSYSVVYYKDTIRDVLENMRVEFVDDVVEKGMVKKCKIYCFIFMILGSATLISYGLDGILQTFWANGTFTTVITFWPDVHDKSSLAQLARVFMYVCWWVLVLRIFATYSLAIITLICCEHQFKHLQIYFRSIGDVFDREFLSADRRDALYVEALVKGIKMHEHLIKYTKLCYKSSHILISGQIIINVGGLALLMLQFVNSERSINNVLSVVLIATALHLTTGFLMCAAGDVSVEASKVATAIYSSRWESCQPAVTRRVRRLLVIAMGQAQNPIILRSLGLIEVSYQSYLWLVKSSYSIFSVLY